MTNSKPKRKILFPASCGATTSQLAEIELAAHAIDQGDAEHGEGGRERADDQIFHPGLQRRHLRALETGEHIERDGDEFQRDKQQAKSLAEEANSIPASANKISA